jgi:hypothetical protein
VQAAAQPNPYLIVYHFGTFFNCYHDCRLNLPMWRALADSFVFAVDDRTNDGTIGAIHASLQDTIPRLIIMHK